MQGNARKRAQICLHLFSFIFANQAFSMGYARKNRKIGFPLRLHAALGLGSRPVVNDCFAPFISPTLTRARVGIEFAIADDDSGEFGFTQENVAIRSARNSLMHQGLAAVRRTTATSWSIPRELRLRGG
jgi:hypothetical protein